MRDEEWDTVTKKEKKERDLHLQRGPPVWMLELTYRPPPPLQPADVLAIAQQPKILLLVGLPGSGKSTVAETLCRVLPWKYVRVNQDELGSRQACLLLTETVLRENKCPVIDRCNISKQQRQYFTVLNVPVDCLVLSRCTPETCVRRCKARQDHPTLRHNDVERVLRQMTAQWQMPNAATEGFRSVTTIVDEATLQSVVNGLLSI
jgi:tRNA uridine 5-carbamoylmethylation protein Kti12